MKATIASILLCYVGEASRLLQSTQYGCRSLKCEICFDNPYTGKERCCPRDDICDDYFHDKTMVVCDDHNTYPNKCYGYCAGKDPDNCQPICKCKSNSDCMRGYECLETPYGFAGCDRNIGNSCYGFCVNKNNPCGGLGAPSPCKYDEYCFENQLFPGLGYCGSLPNKCSSQVVCPQDTKMCPDGSYVSRDPDNNCQFKKCPPSCGGIPYCKAYKANCNNCYCKHPSRPFPIPICTVQFCDDIDILVGYSGNECIKCMGGYVLDDTKQCKKKSESVQKCCDPSDRPGFNGGPICFDGSACCPNGDWSCSIGDGKSYPCSDGLLVVGKDEFGKICEDENTLPPGCASICPTGTNCCDDGFGGVTCCPLDKCPLGQCKDPSGKCGSFMRCFIPPCERTSCGGAASCEPNYCGGCYAIWKDACGNVIPIDECEQTDEKCCDPADRPGFNGGPICTDGSACCGDGTWSCGIGNGEFGCNGRFGKIC